MSASPTDRDPDFTPDFNPEPASSRAPESVANSMIVPRSRAGERLDAVVASAWPVYSRNRLQSWIAAGHLTVDGKQVAGKSRLSGGERLVLDVPEAVLAAMDPGVDESRVVAESVPLDVIFEDESILVLDKPVGLVMHPAPGHASGTVMNGLVYRDPTLRSVPRAGIVHRLDRDTSGVFVVARTLQAQTALVRQLQARDMGREYVAIAIGHPPVSGTVNQPIGRHPHDRKRMAVTSGGKPAITHFKHAEQLRGATRLDVTLETGRTHQIRVHLTSLGHPLIGDPVYRDGRAQALSHRKDSDTRAIVEAFPRQALHAARLRLKHPVSDEPMSFDSPLPQDMLDLCEALAETQPETRGR
jgi:23S rRNA pseudouridine1911/1915/1917 synthase